MSLRRRPWPSRRRTRSRPRSCRARPAPWCIERTCRFPFPGLSPRPSEMTAALGGLSPSAHRVRRAARCARADQRAGGGEGPASARIGGLRGVVGLVRHVPAREARTYVSTTAPLANGRRSASVSSLGSSCPSNSRVPPPCRTGLTMSRYSSTARADEAGREQRRRTARYPCRVGLELLDCRAYVAADDMAVVPVGLPSPVRDTTYFGSSFISRTVSRWVSLCAPAMRRPIRRQLLEGDPAEHHRVDRPQRSTMNARTRVGEVPVDLAVRGLDVPSSVMLICRNSLRPIWLSSGGW